VTGGDFYGRIRYAHAGDMDRPVLFWKDNGTPIVPHWNFRGMAVAGSDPTSGNPLQNMSWPGRDRGAYFGADTRVTPTIPTHWQGSLTDAQGDGTGQLYRRNRYFNPATAQFTQEDPLGLQGGMNLYGYSEGDPVNLSDPFGLCPICVVGAAWALYELASGAYDAVTAVRTMMDRNATAGEKFTTVGLAAASIGLPGGGYTAVGKRVIRFSDEILDVGLRGKSLTSGSKKLRELGLEERVTRTGRHEFVDGSGRVRAAWDPATSKWGNHWHKFGPDGTPVNEAGRVVEKRDPRAHIPSK
jgi:RHS repeat-associated protein